MNEFGAEFNRIATQLLSEDAATDAVAGFENEHRETGPAQLRSRGKPCSSCAHNDYGLMWHVRLPMPRWKWNSIRGIG